MFAIRRFALTMFIVGISLPALGQATRTWVSGVGDDANPCSRTAPCKTFAGAISKTAAGGEISVLDPGGYGAVTITKAIKINGSGTLAGILSSGVSGVIINAGNNDDIYLKNIEINGVGNGTTVHGVRILNAGSVTLEGVEISNIGSTTANHGIQISNSNNLEVSLLNTTIRNVAGNGIFASTGVGFETRLIMDNVRIIDSGQNGVTLSANTKATITRSTFSHNLNAGVSVLAASCEADVHSSMLSRNGFGAHVAVGGGTIRLHSSTITQNTTHGLFIQGGAINSHGNNAIIGNAGNQTPSSNINTQ